MQKAIRINLQARKQAVKAAQRSREKQDHAAWKEYYQQKQMNDKKLREYIKEARAHRREDWTLGPLAPNRNVGLDKGTFGTVDVQSIQRPQIPKPALGGPKVKGDVATDWEGKHRKLKFKGDTIVGNVVVGDRVCVVHGHSRIKGQIGYVSVVDPEREELRITNINVADVKIPAYMPQPPPDPNMPDSSLFNSQEIPIPITHVRLVATLNNPDGTQKDVLVRHVHADGPYLQRSEGSNLPAHTRYISGTGHLTSDGRDIELPWPSDERFAEDRQQSGGDEDTSLGFVEDITWQPSIQNPTLGYEYDIKLNQAPDIKDSILAPYTLGQPKDKPPQEFSNAERAGISGFMDDEKYYARREKIARGIMDELRNKYKRTNAFDDDRDWVSRKMMEDARSIWYQERIPMTPQAEAAAREAEKRRMEREKRMAGESDHGEGASHGERRNVHMSAELTSLVEEMQKANMAKKGFVVKDAKLRKDLRWMDPTKYGSAKFDDIPVSS